MRNSQTGIINQELLKQKILFFNSKIENEHIFRISEIRLSDITEKHKIRLTYATNLLYVNIDKTEEIKTRELEDILYVIFSNPSDFQICLDDINIVVIFIENNFPFSISVHEWNDKPTIHRRFKSLFSMRGNF